MLAVSVHCYFLAVQWPQLSSILMFLLVALYHSKSDTYSDQRIYICHLLQNLCVSSGRENQCQQVYLLFKNAISSVLQTCTAMQ